MIYSPLRVTRTVMLVALPGLVMVACAGADRSGSSGNAASTAANTPQTPLPDSVSALTDSVLRIADASRVLGNSNAKVWMIVMSDFQCPFCRDFYRGAYPRIKKEYLDRGLIRMAYVNFFPTMHTHARTTAERALCAGLQGKFWEFHDALFDSQESWARLPAGTPYFDSLAEKLKLDMNDMELCVSSGMMKTLVAADDMRSLQTGAKGSPAFIVGGVTFQGAHPFEIFKKQLDVAIAASRGASGGK